MTRHGYQTFWRIGLIGLLALLTAACDDNGKQVAPPATELIASFTQQVSGLDVNLDASDSTGDITSYQWDFGDGSSGSGKTASHSYTAAGDYSVVLMVSNDAGANAQQTIVVKPILLGTLRGVAVDDLLTGAAIQVFDISSDINAVAALGQSLTDASGQFQVSFSPQVQTFYRVVLEGGTFPDGNAFLGHMEAICSISDTSCNITPYSTLVASLLDPQQPPAAQLELISQRLVQVLGSESDPFIRELNQEPVLDVDLTAWRQQFANGQELSTEIQNLAADIADGYLEPSANGIFLNGRYQAVNNTPSASFTHSETDLVASLDASASSDSDGRIANYNWNFGDGASGSGKTTSHSYASAGTYTVTLTVTDDLGATATQTASLKVVKPNEPPTAAFTHSETDLVASLDASTSSDSDGRIANYNWNFGDGASGSGKTTSHSYASAGTYTVTLTVEDDQGATTTQSTSINVVAANQLPTARFSVQANRLVVQLDGSTSTDADGRIVGYRWNFGEPAVGGENQSAEQKPQHTYLIPGTYTVTLTVTDDRGGENQKSQNITVLNPIAAVATGKLNDTGITSCADASTWGFACPVAVFPGQDAESGRDADDATNGDSDGLAGFSFTKVDASGEALPASATEWSCVKDNVTGLLWEIHTDDGGLRDKNNTYSWYNPDPATNGGITGTQDGGSCSGGIACDTQGYIAAVNAAGLCGYHDWRLPTRTELLGLVDYDIPEPGPVIDVAYFTDAPDLVLACNPDEPGGSTFAGLYWTSSVAAWGSSVWRVNFCTADSAASAESYSYPYSSYYPLRLVRSEP